MHGTAEIQRGAVSFELRKVTPELLARAKLEAPLAFDDLDGCAALVKHLSRRAPDGRKPRATRRR